MEIGDLRPSGAFDKASAVLKKSVNNELGLMQIKEYLLL